MCNGNCICKIENESVQIKETDAMGREIFWQDAGRPE
jgi:hypothetical protein